VNISRTKGLKAAIAIFALSGLAACGGGGGGGGGTAATGSNDVVPLQGKLTVASSDDATTYTVFNSYQTSTPSSSGSFSTAVGQATPTYTYAVSAAGDKVYAAVSTATDGSVTIDAQSTAEALVLLNPLLIPGTSAERVAVTAIVKADPAVQALATVIQNVYGSAATPLTDTRISDAVTTAVASVLTTWQASGGASSSALRQVLPRSFASVRIASASGGSTLEILNNDMGVLTTAGSAGSTLMLGLNDVGPGGITTNVDWVVRIVELDPTKITWSPSGKPVLGNPTNITDIDPLIKTGGFDQKAIVEGAVASGMLEFIVDPIGSVATSLGDAVFPASGITLPEDGVYAVVALSGSWEGDSAEYASVQSSTWQSAQAAQALTLNIGAAAVDVVGVGTTFVNAATGTPIDISVPLQTALGTIEAAITANPGDVGVAFFTAQTETVIDDLLDYLGPLLHSSVSNLQSTGLKKFFHIAINTVTSVANVWSGTVAVGTRVLNYLNAVTPRESAYALLGAPPVQADTTAPSMPTGLTVTAVSSNQINLTWDASTDNVGVTGYKVYRGVSNIASPTGLSYSDTGLGPSSQYCYAVSAFDAAGNESAQSSVQCATTQASVAAPAAPTGVSATAGNGQATISWSAVSGLTYNLYMASVTGVTESNYSSLAGGTATIGVTSPYVQTGLTNGTTYYFVVTAVNANGESSESSQVSATPQASVVAANTVTEFSAGISAGAHPCGITGGPDGNVWFMEEFFVGAGKIGRISPAGVVTEFSLGQGVPSCSVTAGPDGNIWFTSNKPTAIGRITPAGVITEFSVGAEPGDITTGPDGNLWFTASDGNITDGGMIGRITPTGTITLFSANGAYKNLPAAITAGPDGNLWVAAKPCILRITPAGVLTEFFDIADNMYPSGITVGPDGNLWLADYVYNGYGIWRLNLAGVLTAIGAVTGPSVNGITTGPDGNLWFVEDNLFGTGNGPTNAKIGRITPSGVVTEFSAGISPGTDLEGITAGPDGNLWFTEPDGGRIGRFNLH